MSDHCYCVDISDYHVICLCVLHDGGLFGIVMAVIFKMKCDTCVDYERNSLVIVTLLIFVIHVCLLQYFLHVEIKVITTS